MDKSKFVFGNAMKPSLYKKALSNKRKYMKKFGDDSQKKYHVKCVNNKSLGNILGIQNLTSSKTPLNNMPEKPIIMGNIRMGFGHYRMSMAFASCAHAMGYTPVWMDLLAFPETTGAKVIASQNDLYHKGSVLSQKSKLFNKLIWEHINYTTFKNIKFYCLNQKRSELFAPIFNDIDKDIPIVTTHSWPAQGALHAGCKNVVAAICDDWAMSLHYAEGATHTVQTPNVYHYYKTLSDMDPNKTLKCMPKDSLFNVGHYVDHELVSNIETDCKARIERAKNKKATRYLLSIGGAGAQKETFASIIKHLMNDVKKDKASIFINIGDFKDVWSWLKNEIPDLEKHSTTHFGNFEDTKTFAENALTQDVNGIHVFCHDNIFEAVYSTNILMRCTDWLVTKPSELSFYPVPKLFIKRVGRHEMWGAIHSAHIGDGTPECDTINKIKQMINLIRSDENMLIDMCNNIMKNNSIGIYNGAYEVIKIATKSINK